MVVEQGGSSLPSIDTFDIVATHGDYAPAVFHVVSTVKNADLCIWAVGNRALEFSPETANGNHERLITFKEPGNYVVKLAAYNSSAKQQIEKTAAVVVKKAPAGLVTATLDVAYEAIFVEQKTTNPVAVVRFPAEQKGDLATVTQPIAAELGFEIVKADFAQATHNPSIKSTKVEIDPVKRDKVLLTCELARPVANKRSPSYTVPAGIDAGTAIRIGDQNHRTGVGESDGAGNHQGAAALPAGRLAGQEPQADADFAARGQEVCLEGRRTAAKHRRGDVLKQHLRGQRRRGKRPIADRRGRNQEGVEPVRPALVVAEGRPVTEGRAGQLLDSNHPPTCGPNSGQSRPTVATACH